MHRGPLVHISHAGMLLFSFCAFSIDFVFTPSTLTAIKLFDDGPSLTNIHIYLLIYLMDDCIKDIRNWLIEGRLLLKDDKTEYLVIGTRHPTDHFGEISVRKTSNFRLGKFHLELS